MSRKHLNLGDVLRTSIVAGALLGALVAVPGVASAHTSKHDLDGDGLSNRYERLHTHTNPLKADTNHNGIKDGADDQDGDGLNNKDEIKAGTDPQDVDSDNNGVEDGQEDSDQDGVENEQEQTDGTNPGNPDTDNDGVEDGQDGDANGDGKDDSCEAEHGTADPSCNDDGSEDGEGDVPGGDDLPGGDAAAH